MNYDAFLRTSLAKYRHSDITKKEALNIIRTFNDLRPIISNYVFNDGTRKDLVCLDGTIPVSFKAKTYNIPICIYLLDTHPYNPPLIYVRPTPTMLINPNKHVDHTGRVYLPYLHEWRHPTSDLMGVIQILAIVFGEQPPVFSKSAGQNNQQTRPPMPLPNAASGYPPNTAPYPAPGSVSMPLPSIQTYPTQMPGYNYPTQHNVLPYPLSGGIPVAGVSTMVGSSSMGLSEEERRLSLLSAVEDKMKRRLKEILSQSQAEMEVLRRTQEDLNRGQRKLDDMIHNIDREKLELELNIQKIEEKDQEICLALQQLKVSEEISVDDAVNPTAPLYKQLLNAFAEEQSIDDAIYYIGEALNKNVIELDVFLKKIRELSRKQFMCRMIVQKCRQKAGLPDLST